MTAPPVLVPTTTPPASTASAGPDRGVAPVPRPRRWRWRPRPEPWLPAGLVLLVLVTHAVNITGYPTASDDEGTYLAQAWAVQHGVGLAHYTYWYDHPPLGWLQLAALSWLPQLVAPDTLAVPAGRLAMLPVTAVICVLVYMLGRRMALPRWAAALAVLLCGLSPLAVTMFRQVYLDSFAIAWMLGAFVLALSPRKHLWHHIAAGAAGAVSVLSKETMLLVVPALVFALWQGTDRKLRMFSFAGFISGLVLVGALYPLYAVLRGELFPGDGHVSLIGAWQFQLASREGSGNIFSSGSNASQLLQDWLFYDPVLPVVGTAAAVVALARRRPRPVAVATLLLVLAALRPGGYLPAMYIIQVLPFLALVMATAVVAVVSRAWPSRTGPDPGLRRPSTWVRGLAVFAAAGVSLALLVPPWFDGHRRAWTSDDNARYEAAADWLLTEVPVADRPQTRVVVDDVLWLDLVENGYEREHVIWFYKLDLDPAVPETLPHGWRDVDYLVASPVVRNDVSGLPTVTVLMEQSSVVATFGAGDSRIEIREVTGADEDRR